ncbi:electron transfer flavoprotein subunit beta/FixA family protein [Paenarthrobacter sp. NEAU-H11]|uniref:electron transfer flavoprotein subunit beta/FixA family protein n=1 Tax=Paenarthrobacter sp. NEAU-H11 TaxID=3423924 RepID=UPI003D343D7A
MKIIVLVKQVPDTAEERKLDLATGRLERSAAEAVADEINERALEVALRYKDSDKKGTEVIAMTMGPEGAKDALRKALSMGADSGVHIVDEALRGADIAGTAVVLAAAAQQTGFDLLIAGNESTDGRGGVVPAMVAEHLGLPLLPSLDSVEFDETYVTGEVGLENGTLAVRAKLPAVISVTERAAEARFPNFKGIMTAKRKPLATLSLSDLDHDAPRHAAVVRSTSKRPARTAGKKIYDDGNAGNQLAEFLTSGRLI